MADASLEAARRVKTLAREMVSRTRTVTGVGLAQLNGAYAVKVQRLLDGE